MINKIKKYILDRQIVAIFVPYLDFDGIKRLGVIEVHKSIKDEVLLIFEELIGIGFRIEKVNPIYEYDFSDEKSILDNNSSAYNFRLIRGTKKLSTHSFGMAIDINPKQNPYIHPKAFNFFKYNTDELGTIIENSEIVSIFEKYGWIWGGKWKYPDYQHFQKKYKPKWYEFWMRN